MKKVSRHFRFAPQFHFRTVVYLVLFSLSLSLSLQNDCVEEVKPNDSGIRKIAPGPELKKATKM